MAPFDLDDVDSYGIRRAEKLDNYPRRAEDIMVSVDDREAISRLHRRANMAICVPRQNPGRGFGRQAALAFRHGLGPRRMDKHPCGGEGGISEIRVFTTGRRAGYIPYPNRPLSRHGDGYYNNRDPAHEERGEPTRPPGRPAPDQRQCAP